MGIPESQLNTWANQGAVTTAKRTADSVRTALSDYGDWPDGVDFEVYLQGSYKNDTNIRGDSDVDVVAQLNSSFYSNLSEDQKRQLNLISAAYGWTNFRADVLKALHNHYGSRAITEGNRALSVADDSGRLSADVIACAQYRQYRSVNHSDYTEGMCFWSKGVMRQIINFPKLHYDNGVIKNGAQKTDGWYKPVVRLFKNARVRLVDNGTVTQGLAPSYFLECMIYNVPDNCFGGNYRDTYCAVVNSLNEADLGKFVCQNEELLLLGDSPEQWDSASAQEFISGLTTLWNNW
jgi:hypothetical protein